MNTSEFYQKEFLTEQEAREFCNSHPTEKLWIILSKDSFWVENDDPFIRVWEKVVFKGLGKQA